MLHNFRPFISKTLSLLILLALLAGSLLTLGHITLTQAASAGTILWQQPIVAKAGQLVASPTNAISFDNPDCYRTIGAQTFGTDGTPQGTLPSATTNPAWFSSCDMSKAVDANGVVYSPRLTRLADGTTHLDLTAYSGSKLLWAYTPSCATSPASASSPAVADQVVIGADGNVYLLFRNWNGGNCPYQQLVGLKSGQTTPSVTFQATTPFPYVQSMAAYANGLVLFQQDALAYMDYFGNLGYHTAISYAYPSPTDTLEATINGRAFIPQWDLSSAATKCPNYSTGTIVSNLNAYEPQGLVWSYALPACTQVHLVRPKPDGSAVVWISYPSSTTSNLMINAIIAVDTSGAKLDWTVPLDAAANGRTYVTTTIGLAVDLNGNVIVRRLFTQGNPTYPGIEFDLFGTSGNQVTQFSLATDLGNGLGYEASDVGELALTQNVVYMSVMVCNATYSGCTTDPAKLYAISVPGLQANYPQRAILGGSPVPVPTVTATPSPTPNPKTRNYVALGDSFSSGEGNPPFMTGPGYNSDKDGCHRSTAAYPALLGRTSSLHLQLTFIACSGAASPQVLNGANGEPSQLNSIRSNTTLITISVGGDDIGFADYVKACYTPDELCDNKSSAYDTVMSKLKYDLPSGLRTLFAAIKAKIGPKTKVLVVGYPMILPSKTGKFPGCQFLTPGDVTTARYITALLDSGIVSAVNEANSVLLNRQFVYVDPNAANSPFAGHELCTKSSYFNGLNLPIVSDPNYSFHPNALGQQAYAKLIRPYLG